MTCQHCGAALPPTALFCGECGRSVSAPAVVPPTTARPASPVAAPLGPPPAEVAAPRVSASPDADADAPDPEPVPAPEPHEDAAPALPEPAAGRSCPECGTPAYPDDAFCADCGAALASDTRIIEPLLSPAASPGDAEPVDPAPAAAVTTDPEDTRIVPRATGGARFVLQFSTGESYTVLGSGLAGRNPRPEPGEFVDHLVTIVDPGRSVSKTHFEFGQEAGVFWYSDRHSGNGSVIREPGAEPRACEPGHRYPLLRGTRVDIGEHFVIVS